MQLKKVHGLKRFATLLLFPCSGYTLHQRSTTIHGSGKEYTIVMMESMDISGWIGLVVMVLVYVHKPFPIHLG